SGYEQLFIVWLILQFASTGVVDHAGIKVPFFTFFGHDSGIRAKEPPLNMLIAMGIAASLCVGLGVFYKPLYNMLPFPVHYVPYTGAHVVGQLQLLLFGALAFTLLILSGYYVPEVRSKNIDVDWTYRMFGRFAYKLMDKGLNSLNRISEWVLIRSVKGVSSFFCRAAVNIALFVSVNLWLLLGYRGKRLEIKKERLYNDFSEGTLPLGIGAAAAVSFILLIFILT
ncbi:MAG: Na(+)/H(+) antiporter subunit D, partial [Proteobacteria bacterium]|nr:Na(+)/H(+) antiporter subunit D [Pseudomonadota bacterium]